MGSAAELLDVHAEGARRGDATGGGVRLLEQACVCEFGHLVADGGRAHSGAACAGSARDGAGAYRLAGAM